LGISEPSTVCIVITCAQVAGMLYLTRLFVRGGDPGFSYIGPKKHRCFVAPFQVHKHVGDIWVALFSICFNHGSYGMKGVGAGNPH